ncbi:MAG TPA: hypothetical protein PLA68_18080 [Panacibacter sp.]|nr:hypothetical protein [Panacibacter sp.]
MQPKKTIKLLSLAITSSIVFMACQKEINTKHDAAGRTASTSSDASGLRPVFKSEEMNEVDLILSPNSAADASEISATGCGATITYDPSPNVYPRTVTYDWGTGCTSTTGVTRSGKMIQKYSGDISILGNTVLISYDNFYFNGIKIDGKLKFSNNEFKSTHEEGELKYRLTYLNRKTTMENGNYIIVNGHTKIARGTNNVGYPGFPNGDFREITGDGKPLTYTQSIDGVVRQYTVDIISTLVYVSDCDFITRGTLQYNYADQSVATFDYGTGDCDDQAAYTKDGVTTWVTLGP